MDEGSSGLSPRDSCFSVLLMTMYPWMEGLEFLGKAVVKMKLDSKMKLVIQFESYIH